jgi:hypothetical protein
MFSDEFHEPGTKKEVREKDPPTALSSEQR